MAENKKEKDSKLKNDVDPEVGGFYAPLSGMASKKKRKKAKDDREDDSYTDDEVFENNILFSELNDISLAETVKKRGEQWVVFDDKTGVEKGVFDKRSKAWERQRLIRKSKKKRKYNKKGTSLFKKAPKAKTAPGAKTAPKAKTAPAVKKEAYMKALVEHFSSLLEDKAELSYVFEQGPQEDESVSWENFLQTLDPETVLSDPKMKSILASAFKNEEKVIDYSISAIASTLSKVGDFEVEEGDFDEENAVHQFSVTFPDFEKGLTFGIKIENGRPLIFFPEETKEQLNSVNSDGAKLLKAELMHAQETILDNIKEISEINTKRDQYLSSLEFKIDDTVADLTPLQLAVLKNLLDKKYQGTK